MLSWVGTAFVIGKRLAVTANYVADILVQQHPPDTSAVDEKGKLNARLNFIAEYGTTVSDRVAVRKVHLVHPYWGFAFLELEHDVDPPRILGLSPKPSEQGLQDLDVGVIGYPALDVRNEVEAMKSIFGEIFDGETFDAWKDYRARTVEQREVGRSTS